MLNPAPFHLRRFAKLRLDMRPCSRPRVGLMRVVHRCGFRHEDGGAGWEAKVEGIEDGREGARERRRERRRSEGREETTAAFAQSHHLHRTRAQYRCARTPAHAHGANARAPARAPAAAAGCGTSRRGGTRRMNYRMNYRINYRIYTARAPAAAAGCGTSRRGGSASAPRCRRGVEGGGTRRWRGRSNNPCSTNGSSSVAAENATAAAAEEHASDERRNQVIRDKTAGPMRS